MFSRIGLESRTPSMPLRTLIDNEYVTLTFDGDSRVTIFKRTSERLPLATPDDLTRMLEDLDRKISEIDPARAALLLDVRDAPPPQDESEDLLSSLRTKTFARFAAVAVLVRTAAGRLQINRLARQDGREIAVFFDEHAARKHLVAALAER